MSPPKRRRRTWAIAASALAHVAVLVMTLMQHPNAPLPIGEGALPPDDVIHVMLVPRPRTQPARGQAGPRTASPNRPRRADGSGASTAPGAGAPSPVDQPPTSANGPPPVNLSAALRHGVAGCVNLGATGMSRSDRERCEELLARGVASAPFMPAALEPRMRAYYDAVALAKQRDPPHVAVVNKAPLPFEPPPHRPGGDHLPAFYCSLHFGAGAQPKRLPHALYLGPHCVIEPPKGPLDPEVDITPP